MPPDESPQGESEYPSLITASYVKHVHAAEAFRIMAVDAFTSRGDPMHVIQCATLATMYTAMASYERHR